MSSKGIFTALSGAMAQSQRLDSVANNIANVNTNAFKKDRQVFNEYLTTYEKMPDVIQVPRIPASIESFYHMQGGDKSYVNSSGTYTDFTQGQLKATGTPLDLGLEGAGFFEVLTPQGVRLTRNGSFQVDGLGRLVTREGHPVLSAGLGEDPEDRFIQLNSHNVTISDNGDIYEGGGLVGRLSLVDVANQEALQKVGSSMFTLRENYEPELIAAPQAQVRQGFIEGSNVNIVEEMTNMIQANRIFESTQKAMKAFDDMDGKLVNEVPKT